VRRAHVPVLEDGNWRPLRRRAGGLPSQREITSTSASSVPTLTTAAKGDGFAMSRTSSFSVCRRTIGALDKNMTLSAYDRRRFPAPVFGWGPALSRTQEDEQEGSRGHTEERSEIVYARQSSELRRLDQ